MECTWRLIYDRVPDEQAVKYTDPEAGREKTSNELSNNQDRRNSSEKGVAAPPSNIRRKVAAALLQ
jgi:hypothetical protein